MDGRRRQQQQQHQQKMLEHIVARMEYQNESQHCVATKFNGLSSLLDRPGYEHLLDRDDSKAGMMLIELETPVLFSCTSTLLEDDRPRIIGEIPE